MAEQQGAKTAAAYRRELIARKLTAEDELKQINKAIEAIDTGSVPQLLGALAALGEVTVE